MSRSARFGVLLTLLAAAVISLTAAGCGQQGHQSSPVGSSATLPVLAISAVPGIPSATTRLTTADLAKDAAVRGLAGKIASWGYLGGRQRTFQGESHRLTLVVSRALMFRDAAGAQRYAAFVREHEAAFFGTSVQAQRLSGRSASGWLFTPPLCACHLANPALIGVVDAGSRVIWLEINGPAATPALLVRLLDSAGNIAVARPVLQKSHGGLPNRCAYRPAMAWQSSTTKRRVHASGWVLVAGGQVPAGFRCAAR